jgi:outer membrane protein TolC
MKGRLSHQALAVFLALQCMLAWSAPVTGAPKKALSGGEKPKPKYAGPAPLSLKQAIDIYFKQNIDFQSQLLDQEDNRISFRQIWRKFYLPTLSFAANVTTAQTVATLPGTPARLTYPAGRLTGYPAAPPGASVALTLTSPNLFNFFLDRIAFDKAQMTFERSLQKFEEAKRGIGQTIFGIYTKARLAQEKFEAAERSVQIAEVILNLVRSRKALGTADQTEVDSAEVDRNDARNTLIETRTELKTALFEVNKTLNVNSETAWRLTTSFEYTPLNLSYEQAFEIFKDRSPAMRDAKLDLEQKHMDLETFEKGRMGLPKLTIEAISATYQTDAFTGTNTFSGDRINLTAALTLTIPILDDAGFFQMDASRKNRIGLEKSEISYRKALIEGEADIRTLFAELQQFQDKLQPLKESFDSSAKVLDRLVAEMATKKPTRLELRDAIKNAREKELELLSNVMLFIEKRNDFFVKIGKDLEY